LNLLDKLKSLCENNTQEYVARHVGLKQPQVNHLLTGKRKRIEYTVGVAIEALYTVESNKEIGRK
jgi:predicted XRE-type DNA-binding protein